MWKVQANHFEQSLFAAFVVVVMATTAPSLAQFDSGSDGSDGALDCTALLAWGCEGSGCGADCSGCSGPSPCKITIDLSLASSASWNTPSLDPGKGVYDAAKWAVVYKYTTIDIPRGVRIRFRNHPKGAPVVWLAMGDVNFGGGATAAPNISVDGNVQAESARFADPGPGGFAGGAGSITPLEGSAGFGPGGGERGEMGSSGGGGSYGLPGVTGHDVDGGGGAPGQVYGNSTIVPLIGGSGGAGNALAGPAGGGAGGGAILIASSGSINLGPSSDEFAIHANGGGGNGGGSGGAIRLIANTISGAGQLRALGAVGGGNPGDGHGGDGRIRLEAFTIRDEVDASNPLRTSTDPGPVFPPMDTPTLRAVMVDSVPISADPRAGVQTVDAEVLTNNTVTLQIEATNIAIGTVVKVIVTPAVDASFTCQSTPLAGILSSSTATVIFEPPLCQGLPPGLSDIVLRAEPTP